MHPNTFVQAAFFATRCLAMRRVIGYGDLSVLRWRQAGSGRVLIPSAAIRREMAIQTGRSMIHRSARPAGMMVLTWSVLVSCPATMVAIRASLRTRSLNEVRNPGP